MKGYIPNTQIQRNPQKRQSIKIKPIYVMQEAGVSELEFTLSTGL